MNSYTETSEQIDGKTSRSICRAVGERLQQNLRPLDSELPPHLAHLIDQLRKQEAGDHRMPPN